jgi:glycosyltransferase involved in cell wall biosynthesis
MKIVHIIPGSGDSFYCGNCLRDSKYFEAIRAAGVDAIKVPMYLPLYSRNENGLEIPVFYGAVNIYLKQLFPVFKHAPKWFENFLNSKPMLKFAASQANSTRAKGLEEMTVSMLMGEDGEQKEELEKMVDWLENHYKADIIHISNALLLGLAHKIRERLKVPVVCSLQDEDVWVDIMSAEKREQVWSLMREKSRDIDMFVSVSHYYTSFMKDKLHLPDEKITTLHLGVDPADYAYLNASKKEKNIGYLSRLCEENGLDILVDAFILFKKLPGNEHSKLILTGGHTSDDNHFIKEQKTKLSKAGLMKDVEFIDDFKPKSRQMFFDKIAVLSVPVRHGEAFGIYLTEAMAAGIPIVQPALGAFPEIVAKSGGGITYAENSPEMLSKALNELMKDDAELQKLSLQARQSVENKFNINFLSKIMTEIYQKTIDNYKAGSK